LKQSATEESVRNGNPPARDGLAAEDPGGVLRLLVRLPTFQAFRYRQYRLLWYGQVGNGLAQWMDQVTRGWLMYELTDSALQLGSVTAIRVVPLLIFSPIAGTVADRYGRKTQLIAAQSTNAALFAIMAALILTRTVHPWHVYAVALAGAVVQVFQLPARQVMTTESVPPRDLTNAIGLGSVAFNGSRSVGPAVAGILIAVAGTGGSYAAQAMLMAASTFWTMQLRPELGSSRRLNSGGAGRLGFFSSTVEGWQFVLRNETVRTAMMVMMMVALLTWPFTTLLPIFARDILHAGSSGQGFLLGSMGIGALLSAVLIASLGDRLPKGILMVSGAFGYGALLVAFAVSQWFSVSLALMVAIGVTNVFCSALVQTVVQAHSPPEIRGRVMSVYQQRDVFNTAGSMMIGALAAAWGAPWAMALMSGACAAGAVAIFVAVPHARTIR